MKGVAVRCISFIVKELQACPGKWFFNRAIPFTAADPTSCGVGAASTTASCGYPSQGIGLFFNKALTWMLEKDIL